MTAKINLLPWREELRNQRNRAFGVQLLLVASLMAAVIGYWYLDMDRTIKRQQARVKYLKDVDKEFDNKIAEIKDIDKEEERLKKRIEVIEKLQGSRPEIVKVFDELALSLPEGLYLSAVSNRGSTITLHGYADSNNTVSNFMRSLDKSEWFNKPDLISIERAKAGRQSKFMLKVSREFMSKEKDGKKKKNKKRNKG